MTDADIAGVIWNISTTSSVPSQRSLIVRAVDRVVNMKKELEKVVSSLKEENELLKRGLHDATEDIAGLLAAAKEEGRRAEREEQKKREKERVLQVLQDLKAKIEDSRV